MKKLIFNVLALSMLGGISNNAFASTNLIKLDANIESVSSRIKVNITIKSKEGCVFKIQGDYNTWSGTFTGTVTASGPNGCPTGTYTFGLIINNNNGTTEIHGENAFVSMLQSDSELLTDLVNAINESY